MTIEILLKRHMVDKANLNIKKMLKLAQRQNILDESATQSGEKVQTSGLSDTTSQKAMRLIEKDEAIEQVISFLELRCGAVDHAVNSLTDIEIEIIERIFFRGQTYKDIDQDIRVPPGTCKRVKKDALIKLEFLLGDIMEVSPIWSQNDPFLSHTID